MNNDMAPLSSRLFMIVRELPSYLSVAHSLRYKEVDHQKNLFNRIYEVSSEYLQLIKELLAYRPSNESFDRNIKKLDADFDAINANLKDGKKSICTYFVSTNDHNGAIIGDHLYYYHHYKIRQFQNYYDVAAKVIRDNEEMHEHLKQLKSQFPSREVKVIDIVSHGGPDMLNINLKERMGANYSNRDIKANEFNACADDAVIILDACSTAVGVNSIAENIAKNNPGKTVIAPAAPLYFSKPIFKTQNQETFIDNVVHGFAIINAYTSKKFQFAK